MNRPRLILAGLSGGAGKTILTLGVCRSWVRKGRKVKPYKKGPDYIDAMWLGLAAGQVASNLDPFLMDPDRLRSLFWDRIRDFDLGLVEGNRGLFDGKDVDGSCSTAELARQLQAPVVLVMDCTKMTRTAAAVVAGCRHFEEDFHLAGVICNRTAGERHRSMLRQAIEQYTDVPVLGCLPKIKPDPIPERHMGLVSSREQGDHDAVLNSVADIIDDWVDTDRLWDVAASAPEPTVPPSPLWPDQALSSSGCTYFAPEASAQLPSAAVTSVSPDRPRIGYVLDDALWFYYEENLDALEQAGAELIRLSVMDGEAWPELDGLYLGGGYPEVHGRELAANESRRAEVRALCESGLPVYAECGGFMYLAESVITPEGEFPMAGVFPVRTRFFPKPQGLGYIEAEARCDTPFYSKGDRLIGHEFHYSTCVPSESGNSGDELRYALSLSRGAGMHNGLDGLVFRNTVASYTHIHALGCPDWAPRFVAAARAFREGKGIRHASGGQRVD